MLQIYMDESGIHEGSPSVVVSGYIGRPEAWGEWTRQWVAALHPISVYHAVDAQNLTGEFDGWSADQVASLVKKLLPITADADIGAITVALDMRLFEAAMKGREDLRALFGTPYIACLQWTMQGILNLARQYGNTEAVSFIHENNDYHGQAYECFSWIKENLPQNHNVVSLTFGAKKDYPPLQAADILAYETNKRLRNLASPERRPWAALKANTFAVSYGDSNMDHLVATLEKIRDGKFADISGGIGWNRSWRAP